MDRKKQARIVKQILAMGFHALPGSCDGMRGKELLTVIVSAEHGDNAADYWGEFRGDYPWINPRLEALAAKHGMFWQWENPGAISLWD